MSFLYIHKFFWGMLFFYPVLYNLVGGVSNAQRLMHVFFFIVLAFTLLLNRPKFAFSKLLFFSFIYTLVVVTYYIFNTLFFTEEKSLADFADFTRPFVYLLYFSIPLFYPITDTELNKLFNFILKLLLLSIVFSAFVYIPFTYPLVDLYKGRMSTDAVIMHFYRWSGTFGYPSDFAFLISLFIYWMFFKYAYGVITKKIKFWSLFFLLMLGLLMTVSRGGIFSTIFMLGISYIFSSALFRFRVNLIVFPALLIMFFGFLYILNSEKIVLFGTDLSYLTGVMANNSDGIDSSSKHRLRELNYAIDFLVQYFPFGSGSNRIGIKQIIDPLESFYGYHFIKWGFLGFILHMCFIGWASLSAGLHSLNSKINKPESAALYSAFVIFILSVPIIMGFSSAMSDRFKVVVVYYLVCGYGVMGYVKNNKKIGNFK